MTAVFVFKHHTPLRAATAERLGRTYNVVRGITVRSVVWPPVVKMNITNVGIEFKAINLNADNETTLLNYGITISV